MLYRIIDFIPDEVAFLIKSGFIGHRVMTTADNVTWKPVKPTEEELKKANMISSSFKFIDPNEVNKKLNYPPNYLVRKSKEKIHDIVAQHFKIDKIIKDLPSDFIFEGSKL